MLLKHYVILWLLLLGKMACSEEEREDNVTGGEEKDSTNPKPLVFLAILARNHAHTLPFYFSYIDKLDYPKDRMHIWLYTDNNMDSTASVMEEWVGHVSSFYHIVNFTNSDVVTITDTDSPYEWSDGHYENIVAVRQRALDEARRSSADYLMFVDCDNFLVETDILNILIAEDKPIIAPMLTPNREDTTYSNFWCGIDDKGYYRRTEDYIPILRRERKGCYKVPMVHSTFLVNLRLEASRQLAYWPPLANYHSPTDDILLFAHSAREAGMDMYVLNKQIYGFLQLPKYYETIDEAVEAFDNFKLDGLIDFPPVTTSDYVTFPPDLTPNDTMGFDRIFMINLERRPDRRNRMFEALKLLHLEFEWIKAVDGRTLDDSYSEELGIKMLPDWKDPWGDRPITKGEIGCFLSHYFIWEKVVENNWQKILIFEDDIKFQAYFRDWMDTMLSEIEEHNLKWDLIYIGRKRLHLNEEQLVEGTTTLIRPKYSYWTLSYMLSLSGAKKLLAQSPLQKILPVDEYLPIMFDEHPTEDWSKYFWPRNLIAYSANPLFVYPTHYVGDEDYFSDTEPLHVFRKLNQKQMEEMEERKQKNIDDTVDYLKAVHSEL